jgi:competence protein ComEC
VAFIAVAASGPVMARKSSEYQMSFVDVGQGDSTVVLWPGGGSMVIDGGPRYDTFDSGRSIVAPILWRQGRSGLDALIATHDDGDHSGGLEGLSTRIAPAVFLDNGGVVGADSPLRALRDRFGALYRPIKSGDRISFPGGLEIEALNPPSPPYPYPDEFNNRSLVLKLSLGPVKVLMMGDVSKETERWLLNSGADLKADVIKIAHHGSDSSSSPEFLDAVGAKTVVISAGRNNVHRHPNKKVLARLYERGIRVFRTDLHGEVVMTVKDGKASFDYYSANAAIYGR